MYHQLFYTQHLLSRTETLDLLYCFSDCFISAFPGLGGSELYTSSPVLHIVKDVKVLFSPKGELYHFSQLFRDKIDHSIALVSSCGFNCVYHPMVIAAVLSAVYSYDMAQIPCSFSCDALASQSLHSFLMFPACVGSMPRSLCQFQTTCSPLMVYMVLVLTNMHVPYCSINAFSLLHPHCTHQPFGYTPTPAIHFS